MEVIIRTLKVQLKPNNKQRTKLFQSAGTARWVYNWTLARQEMNYKAGGKFLSDNELRKEITQIKKQDDFKWLSDVSNNVAKQAVKDACNAYKNFFSGRTKYPKFKSKKKSKPAFYHDNVKLKVSITHAQLEKIGKIKMAEFNRIPTGVKYYNPRIKFDGLNWWISVGIDETINTKESEQNEPIGIDLGIKDLAILSNGDVYKNINKSKEVKRLEKKKKRLQRQASRKYECGRDGKKYIKTANIAKLEKEILKIYKQLTNIRDNYNHQITNSLVKTKPSYIVVENLNISGMMKNKHLSKAIQQQKLFDFTRMLEYKCLWNDVRLVKASRWFPSSKTCSECGIIKPDLKLSDRVYSCECGLEMDRDLNAAINLRKYGELAG